MHAMETTVNMGMTDVSMSEKQLEAPSSTNNKGAELLMSPGWNRMREQQKQKQRVLEAMAHAENDEAEELMLTNLSKAIMQHPRETQMIQRMSEAGMLKRSTSRISPSSSSHASLASLGSIKESQPLASAAPRRRRYQRRNSFVIHRKNGGSNPSLLGMGSNSLYKSTPNFQKNGSRKKLSAASMQNPSWANQQPTSTQNATWGNTATSNSTNNVSWANTNNIWFDLKPLSINSKPTIPQPLPKSTTGERPFPDEIMKSPDACCTKKISSLSGLGGSYNSVLNPFDVEESPRTPRMLVQNGVQHHLDAPRYEMEN